MNEGDYRMDPELWPVWMLTLTRLHSAHVTGDKNFRGTLDRAFEVEQVMADERWRTRGEG